MSEVTTTIKRGWRQCASRWAPWWCGGWLLALIVKVLGLEVGGWVSLGGLLLLSAWLPRFAEHQGPKNWRWRQRFAVWGQLLLTALPWLPLGWAGYLATLQVSVQLPASWQNVIFNSRYDWLPFVVPAWLIWWGVALKWLPSLKAQLQTPTGWRQFWLRGWQTSWWRVALRLLPWTVAVICWWGLAAGCAAVVWGLELIQPAVALVAAVVSLSLLQGLFWLAVMGTWAAWWPQTSSPQKQWWVPLLLLGLVSYATWWLTTTPATVPAVIAHRGVDGHDGVQNTTKALKRTVKRVQPALVEMDIQPTRDHHWVVMHDPTLEHLAKRPGPVKRYRLEQLTGLPLAENGQAGALSSFKGYFTTARQLHQPLLVEIKALGAAGALMGPFADRYAHQLVATRGAVHSLDYQIIARLKQRATTIRVGWITPFYLTAFPENAADFYSLQALTVTREQVNAAHRQHRAVYLWTVDRASQMQRLSTMGVDGLITNRPSRLRRLQTQRPHNVFNQLANWLTEWL